MKISYLQLAIIAFAFVIGNFAYQALNAEMWHDAIMRSYWECVAFANVALCGWISGKLGD